MTHTTKEGAAHVVTLPWPARALHPNARVHWSRRAKAAKRAREDAAWLAVAAGVEPLSAQAVNVTMIFFPPDNRPRDVDGMLSACKASIDGIADLLGIDDSRWNFVLRREPPKKPGSVRIEIEVAA